jgi:hypothetical protein
VELFSKPQKINTASILDALIATAQDKIWATELALLSGSRRVDFWTLEPAASRGWRAMAYEIKISRGDFKRDTDEKQLGAIRWSDRFWYVTPPGLIDLSELPFYAGLQEWTGERFEIKRKAPKRAKEQPDWDFVVALIRNSGDVRRDVGLLKAQLAFLQQKAERDQAIRRTADRMSMERWIRRAQTSEARTKSAPPPSSRVSS